MSREPEFRDYLLALRKGRAALLLWVVFCAAAALVYTRFQPVTYLATATVVMLPPKLQTELSPAGLTLRTYEALLLSDSIISSVVKKARIEGLTAGNLRGRLKVKFLTEDESRSPAPAPLLQLSATAGTPDDAEKIANLWAEALIDRSSGLRTAQTTEAVKTLEGLVAEARIELERIDARLTEFSASSNIPFLESKLEVVGEKLKLHQGELLDTTARLESLRVSADRREKLLALIEKNNRWIGAIRPEEFADGANQAAVESKPSAPPKQNNPQSAIRNPKPKQSAPSKPKNQQTKKSAIRNPQSALLPLPNPQYSMDDGAAEARRNLLETERDLIRYKDKFDVEVAAQQKDIYKKTLEELRLELSETLHDISAQKPLVEQTRARLAEQPQFVELSSAIADEALWMKLSSSISASDAKALSEMKLTTQVMNPVYFDTMKTLVKLEAEYDALGEKKTYLEDEVNNLSARLRTLDESLARRNTGMEYLAKLRLIELNNYDALSARYNALRDGLADDTQQASLAAAQAVQLQSRVEKMTAEFNILLEEVDRLKFEQSRLNTERDTIAESFKMLSQKSEEARISRAYETADVKMAARAVAPEKPQARGNMKRSAAAAGLALAIGIAFIIATEFTRITLTGGDLDEGEKIVDS